MRDGLWKTWGPLTLLGQDIHGATLGLVGFGRIGQAVARRARRFDMRVLYHSRSRRPDVEAELGVTYRDLDSLLAAADFVSLHTPLTPAARHLIDARR
ncbi:MAG: NAD(P)-dependent oxidoreductase [Caldilineales bacterium]